MPPRQYDFSGYQGGFEALVGSALGQMGDTATGVSGFLRKNKESKQADEDRRRRHEEEDIALDEYLRSIGRGGLEGVPRTPDFNPNAAPRPDMGSAMPDFIANGGGAAQGVPVTSQDAPGQTNAPFGAPSPSEGPQGLSGALGGALGGIRRKVGSMLDFLGSGGFEPSQGRVAAPPKTGPSDAERGATVAHGRNRELQEDRQAHDVGEREADQAFRTEMFGREAALRMSVERIQSGRASRNETIQTTAAVNTLIDNLRQQQAQVARQMSPSPQDMAAMGGREAAQASAAVARERYNQLEAQINQWLEVSQGLTRTMSGANVPTAGTPRTSVHGGPAAASDPFIDSAMQKYQEALRLGADPERAKAALQQSLLGRGQ